MKVKELLKLSLEELVALEDRLWKEWQSANKAKELMQIMKEEDNDFHYKIKNVEYLEEE